MCVVWESWGVGSVCVSGGGGREEVLCDLNVGSANIDSPSVVIPKMHSICYMDYKKEVARQKSGNMLNACCAYLKNVSKVAPVLIVNASIFIIVSRLRFSVKCISSVCKAEYI